MSMNIPKLLIFLLLCILLLLHPSFSSSAKFLNSESIVHDFFPSILSYLAHIADRSACSVVSDSLWSHGMKPTRLLCPWNLPGKNIGVGCHFLLQGIFPIQRLNLQPLHLLHWQAYSLPLWHTDIFPNMSNTDAWGWCTGMIQRDGVGREEGGGFRMGSTCIPVADSFWCLAKLIQCFRFKNKIKFKKNKK